MEDITVCPGCQASLPKKNKSADNPFNASTECWAAYCDLSVYTLSLGDREFIHQYAVDAYEAQHAGGISKNISAAFGLIGLYLAVEKGYTGRQVQLAHMELANRNKKWPRFLPPTTQWQLTAADVLRIPPGPERNRKIFSWAQSVWEGWKKDRQAIILLTEKYLYP